MARIIELIETERVAGEGKDNSDPIRPVAQLWTKQGVLVAEYDIHDPSKSWYRPENGF